MASVLPSWNFAAENDFDSNGLALVDEFSDAISACIEGGFEGAIEILSIHESKSKLTLPLPEKHLYVYGNFVAANFVPWACAC